VYLNIAKPNPGSLTSTACILPGIYTGEELAGLDVDVLSSALQPFPQRGDGTDDVALTGEVWLTGGDVNASADPTIIADIAGEATKGTADISFTATVTIGANRLIPSSDPSQPSLHPICKQRIVTPIVLGAMGAGIQPVQDGTLVVTIDPTLWLANVDFSSIAGPPFAIPDDNTTPAGNNLFTGLRAASGTFALELE
jgi:hypothetical protein